MSAFEIKSAHRNLDLQQQDFFEQLACVEHTKCCCNTTVFQSQNNQSKFKLKMKIKLMEKMCEQINEKQF